MVPRLPFRRRLTVFYVSILVFTVLLTDLSLFLALDAREMALRHASLEFQVGQIRTATDRLFQKVRSDLAFVATREEYQDLGPWYRNTDYREKRRYFSALAPLTDSLDSFDEAVVYHPSDGLFLDLKNKLVSTLDGSRLAVRLTEVRDTMGMAPDLRQTVARLTLGGREGTYLIRRIEAWPRTSPLFLVAQVSDGVFTDVWGGLVAPDEAWIEVLNERGQPVFGRPVTGTGLPKGREIDQLTSPGFSGNGKDLVATEVSADTRWTYLVGTPTSTVRAGILGVLVPYSLLPLVLLALALGVILRWSPQLYRPVTNLFASVGGDADPSMTDEFALIQAHLEGLRSRNSDLEATLVRTRSWGGSQVLGNLALRGQTPANLVYAAAQGLGWSGDPDGEIQLTVYLVLLRESSDLPTQAEALDDLRRSLWAGDESTWFAGFSPEGRRHCWVGIAPRGTPEPLSVCDPVPQVASVGVSRTHGSWDSLGEAYREARIALDHRTLAPNPRWARYTEVAPGRRSVFFYPDDSERQILHAVKQLDGPGAADLYQGFSQIVRGGGLAFGRQKALHLHLLDNTTALLRDHMVALGPPEQALLGEVWDRLGEADNSEAVESAGAQVLELVLVLLGEGKESPSARIANEARTFIEERYSDRNLSLDLIASSLGYSVSHIGAVFRAYFGETVKNTITGLRLSRAQELLTESDEKILRISEAVGYDNLGSFEKIFKAYVGESPKDFRLRTRKR